MAVDVTGQAARYVILLPNAALVATYQALYPNGVKMAPSAAATFFGAPIGGMTPSGPLTPPAIMVQWTGYTWTANNLDVFTGIIPGTNWVDGFGTAYNESFFFWTGYFAYLEVGSAPSGSRQWIVGFEEPRQGENMTEVFNRTSRHASRTAEGLGYAYRASQQNDAVSMTPPALTDASAQRFYIRLRTLPSANVDMIWGIVGSNDNPKCSIHLDVTTTGAITLYNQGVGAYPGTVLVTSSPLTLNTWYRVDIYFQYARAGVNPLVQGIYRFYLNGTLVTNGSGTVDHGAVGLGTIQTHNASALGNFSGAGTTNGLECDFDDWIADTTLIDVTIGSHISLVRPTGFGAAHSANYVGNWRQLLPLPSELSSSVNGLTTQTASATLEVTTDYVSVQRGPVSILVGAYNIGANGGGTGAIGYNATTSAVTIAPNTFMRKLTSNPTLGSTMTLMFQKDASGAAGNAVSMASIYACVEFAGSWGAEDAAGSFVPGPYGVHNAPYQFSNGASATNPRLNLSPVGIWSGTYTGNNLGQDVIAQIPAHWWWVRALTADSNGVLWWSSMVCAHPRRDALGFPVAMPQALLDGTTHSSGTLRIAGVNAQSNQSAIVYQWIAFSDPSARFMLNGAFTHFSSLTTAANALADTAFTPEGAFFCMEKVSGSTASQTYFKGIGHTVDTASLLDATQTTTVATLAAGVLTSKTPLHTTGSASPQTAYCLLRRTDGNSGAKYPFDLVTYTGNGAGGNRDIACVLNGLSPLFAMVTPHNGISYHRDPSHSTTHSSDTAGTDSTTAITGGGTNKITVGTALNANGIVYDVFVLPGLNSGPTTWSTNPTTPIFPVSPFGVLVEIPEDAQSSGEIPTQWRLQRFDIKPRKEDTA